MVASSNMTLPLSPGPLTPESEKNKKEKHCSLWLFAISPVGPHIFASWTTRDESECEGQANYFSVQSSAPFELMSEACFSAI